MQSKIRLLRYNYKMQDKQKIQQRKLNELLTNQTDKKVVSLPLEFQFLPVQLLSKQFTKLNNNNVYRIHYLGPRLHNTLSIHKKFARTEKNPYEPATKSQYNHNIEKYTVDTRKIIESYFIQEKLRVNTFYKSNLFYRAFEGMNPTLNLQKQYVFNSVFQSGNLDCVIKIQENEFDLFLRIDSNTKGHVQWFYFSVMNGSRKQKVKLNLCNLSKSKTLYESGLQPYIFSRQKFKETEIEWIQGGVNLGFEKKELRYDYLQQKVKNLSYYCLEFEYKFQYENDQVFFAYCVPYTFSKLINEISKLPSSLAKKEVLGKSLSGVEIPLIHITDHDNIKNKKNILITGRMHPGQPNSSHMLQGFIEFLTSQSKEAIQLRRRINFYIIPMVNPDGVIIGNSRTSAAGKDLNRQFLLANRDLYPQVALTKEFAKNLHNSQGIFMYLDFHGHSRKKNTFFYGPNYNISEPNYYKSRILPKIIEKINPNFRFHSCSFMIDQEKKQTARAVLFQHLKINFTFTIETSIGYFYDCQNFKTEKFSILEWKKMGASIAEGITKFVVGFEEYECILRERRLSRKKKRITTAKNVTENRIQLEQQSVSQYKKLEPLKIPYNDKSLFGEFIQQLKSTAKNINYIKEIDDDCDSDAYDENQDFQLSKMKQFNLLLTDTAHRSIPKKKTNKNNYRQPQTEREKGKCENPDNILNIEEELLFLNELQEMKKPTTMQAKRQKTNEGSSKNTCIRKQLKTSSELKRAQLYRTTVLTQKNNLKQKKDRLQMKFLNQSIQKKMVSQGDLNANQQNEKVSYFGQYHLFVDKIESEPKVNLQRNSLFRRQKSKKGRRSQIDESKYMSQSFLDKNINKNQLYQNIKPVYEIHHLTTNNSPPAKSNNFEFKFDQIETAVVAKQKLKEYLRAKISKSNRSNVIGPASFYGIRQNLNMKLNNKKKFFEKQKCQSQGKDSIKIIKFT